MNKILTAVLAIVLVVSLGLSACFVFGVFGGSSSVIKVDDKNVKVITVPEQKNGTTVIPSAYIPEETTEGWKAKTENLALNKQAKCNGFTDVYMAKFVTDGDTGTGSYWEGKAFDECQGKVNTLSVDLEKATEFNTVVVKLNPARIWAKRTQTFSVQTSDDGVKWTEVLEAKDYSFDPKTGNLVVVTLDPAVKAQYVQLTISKNSGAVGGQAAEFEIYNEK